MDEQRQPFVENAEGAHLFSQPDQLSSTLTLPTRYSHVPSSSHERGAVDSAFEFSANENGERHPNDHISTSNTESSSRSHEREKIQAKEWQDERFSSRSTTGFSRRPQFFLNWWLELGSCFMSIAALIALFGTVFAYKNKPAPDWPTWLSLNTIVAIYIVFLKAGVLLVTAEGLGQLKWSWFLKDRPLIDLAKYDDATRGPAGALKLLWKLRMHHMLASCGAMITVLALAVDPFAQQIIKYHDCITNATGTPATVPRTNYFYDRQGVHVGAQTDSVGSDVQNAINAGIFSPLGSVSAACPTGNCTWSSEYSTVGYCSECEDITALLSFKNHTFQETRHYPNPNGTQYTKHVTFTNLTTYLPHKGLAIDVSSVESTPVPFVAMGPAPYDVIGYNDHHDPWPMVIDFVLAKHHSYFKFANANATACSTPIESQEWKCKGYGASRCHIYPCVKTYTASARMGVLTETLVRTSSTWGEPKYGQQWFMIDLQCIDTEERQLLKKLGYDIKAEKYWLPYHSSGGDLTPNGTVVDDIHLKSMTRHHCVYAIDLTTASSFSSYFGSYLNGLVSGTELPYGAEWWGAQVVQAFFNYGEPGFGFHWVEQLFQNMTESITNHMRQSGVADFSEPARGVARQDKTCIAVRWAWLTYPAFLVLLTLWFFTWVALETRTAGNRPAIWKSSPLALLYHGFAGKAELDPKSLTMNDLETTKGMHKLASTTVVRLDRDCGNVARLQIQNRVLPSHSNIERTQCT